MKDIDYLSVYAGERLDMKVKHMIDAGAGWTAEEIQAAVEEAGFDINVEDAARPDFHIPETQLTASS